ncbi:MAG: TIGR02147 family protein [Chitinivibrionales bacterium]|nr:TIGR02147 family protein [Chitinivibrionales bacterium]
MREGPGTGWQDNVHYGGHAAQDCGMASILEYMDYRAYLKDFYRERKSRQSWFSYRVFSSGVGIDASYLAKVLTGTRHIADRSIGPVADYCGLHGRDKDYFEDLVRFAKAATSSESRLYFEKLLEIKGVRSRTLESDQYDFYRHWYVSAIRAVLEFYPFYGRDYRGLGEQLNPPVTAKQAREAVQLLERLELVGKDDTGRYVLTQTAITSGERWRSVAIQSFQESTIALAREALDRHPREHRDISTITLNINERDVAYIREKIREFRQSIISHVNDQSDPDRTYHMNIQLIPLTRIPSKGGDT